MRARRGECGPGYSMMPPPPPPAADNGCGASFIKRPQSTQLTWDRNIQAVRSNNAHSSILGGKEMPACMYIMRMLGFLRLS